MRTEILIVGNYCHDTLELADKRTVRCLGGSSSYISRMVGLLGARYSVVAKVGEDFAYDGEVVVAPARSRDSLTTSFRNVYEPSQRRNEYIENVCAPLTAADLKASDYECEVAVACGVAFEILPETLLELRRRSRLLLCDVQGLLRARVEEGPDRGRIFHRPLSETNFATVVDQVDYLKASREEAQFLDLERLRHQTAVVVTDGPRGATLFKGEVELHVPALPANEIDPTGAGDCFLAGFAVALLRDSNISTALRVANLCGAFAVSQVGVPQDLGHDLRDLFDSTSTTTTR